jgi:hyperosmotically inducible protein
MPGAPEAQFRAPAPRTIRLLTHRAAQVTSFTFLKETRMRVTSVKAVFSAILLALVLGCAGAGTKTGEFIDDRAITAKVKTALAKDPDVSALAVNVDTDKGVVTLNGTVKSATERNKAAQLARNVEGVTSVRNNLTIK